MNATEKTEKVLVENWVCAGWRTGAKNKRVQLWRRVEGDDIADPQKEENRGCFAGGLVKGAYVGSVWKLTWTADRSAVKKDHARAPQYVGRFGNAELTLQWEAEESADNLSRALDKKLKQDGLKKQLEHVLAPIGALMAKTDYDGRRALKLLVSDTLDNLARDEMRRKL